jgi:hypothetical protein
MSEDAHIIEIDSIVIDRVDPNRPGGVRALVEAETRRVMLGTELSAWQAIAGSEAAIAGEVARSVDRAIKGGAGDA